MRKRITIHSLMMDSVAVGLGCNQDIIAERADSNTGNVSSQVATIP